MVKQMLLHTCNSLTMLSRITFVIVPSWPKLVNSLPNILHFTLITGQKVDQTSLLHIYIYVIYIHIYICIYMYICICIYVMYIYMYICICRKKYIFVLYMYIFVYICIYIFIYIYWYIYISISKNRYIDFFLLTWTVMFFLYCMPNTLRYEKIFCEIDESIAYYEYLLLLTIALHDASNDVIFLGVHSKSIFPFMQYCFSQENCVSFGLLVSCLSLS